MTEKTPRLLLISAHNLVRLLFESGVYSRAAFGVAAWVPETKNNKHTDSVTVVLLPSGVRVYKHQRFGCSPAESASSA